MRRSPYGGGTRGRGLTSQYRGAGLSPGRRRRHLRRQHLRRRLAAALGLLALVAGALLALEGTLSHTSRDAQLRDGAGLLGPATSNPKPAAPRDPRPPALLAPGARPPATSAARHLGEVMSRAMGQAGPGSGAFVYDLTGHAPLYAFHAGTPRPPASVEKLWTTVAVMLRLGPYARLRTQVLGTGSQRGGVWHGDLYLRGGGDPTYGDQTFNRFWNHSYGPTSAQIVTQLLAHGIHRVTGHLYGDESLFDRRRGGLMTGFEADIPDYEGQLSALTYDHGTIAPGWNPATFAAHELVLTMRGSHIAVSASPHDGVAPRRARVLASVSSPPMSVMARLMDVPSDDLFADLFTKLLGVRFGGGGTIPAGARVMEQTIAHAYGLHPRILDGSGLGRGDRTSPLQIVQLLAAVRNTAVGHQLAAALPTVGREGTVQYLAAKTPASGNCIAKTGTLNYVTNLAGYCRARSGHLLAFALFIDGPGNVTGDVLETKMIAAIARY